MSDGECLDLCIDYLKELSAGNISAPKESAKLLLDKIMEEIEY